VLTGNTRNWNLVLLKDGKAMPPVALNEGVTTIGRDPSNTLPLNDRSVSRQHASIERGKEGVLLRDLDSRNGVRVNGVPRKQATLQAGDVVEVGIFTLHVANGQAESPPPGALGGSVSDAARLEQTERRPNPLPRLGGERQLSTLYHVCSWLAEDIEEKDFTENCLRLLLEGLNASEAQFYGAGRELEKWVAQNTGKPCVRVANYLADRFQSAAEAVCVRGADAQRFQKQFERYNFLVGPLRPLHAEGATFPFVVLIRPADWDEFGTADRVLLQAICQLWVRTLHRARKMEALRTENAALKRQAVPCLVGAGKAMERLRQEAVQTARTKATVCLLGETGSGKEVVAQFIHAQSPRAGGPFIKVNCAAVPDGLIESELFGHVRGAFTDARADRRGKFEQAHGGTLFLDEIGDMPLAVQSKLLRAIENGEIEKVGGDKVLLVDVRLIAASHRDLAQLVRDGRFREDLYYRLRVVSLRVPPLREHADDIGILADHFLQAFCNDNGLADLKFEDKAIDELKRHSWPGNVRELRNVVQRCAVAARDLSVSARLVREKIKSDAL